MCGIIGYLGKKQAKEILLYGLKKMEYRGYDSAGLVLFNPNTQDHILVRSVGKINNLEHKVQELKLKNYLVGIAHTRWATHGKVEERNAHPQSDSSGQFFIVHNGIIENYQEIKTFLESKGSVFKSETDTEVLVELIAHVYDGDLLKAVKKALSLAEGAYGIAVMHQAEPEKIVAAKHGSPLVLGIGNGEMFLASDTNALQPHIEKVIYLDDNEVVDMSCDHFEISQINSDSLVTKDVEQISIDISELSKGKFEHFMLKEIYEQPISIQNTYKGKMNFEQSYIQITGIPLSAKQIRNITKITFLACGSSWHVGMIGKYLLEKIARISSECEYASEYRYRDPVINPDQHFIAISQSGETADTLAAMKMVQHKGSDIFGITNVVGSSIARLSNGGLYIHAGHEDGVAATKTFTSQLMGVVMMAVYLGSVNNNLNDKEKKEIFKAIHLLPTHIRKILSHAEEIKQVALKYKDATNAIFLGRDLNFPIALEGALKLKEISYIHAEGYPAAEMKHGPLALVDENMPCFIIAPQDHLYGKILSNIQEVKARNGKTIVITTENNDSLSSSADDMIFVPKTHEIIQPILNIIPLQLLSYYIATSKGINVDRPRNLAKSVTVE